MQLYEKKDQIFDSSEPINHILHVLRHELQFSSNFVLEVLHKAKNCENTMFIDKKSYQIKMGYRQKRYQMEPWWIRSERRKEMDQKIALSVTEAAEIIGVGKSTMYELIKRGDCDFAFMLGGRRLISRAKLEEWVYRQAERVS